MRTILILLAVLPFLASCSDKAGMLSAQLESQREKAGKLEAELQKVKTDADALQKEWESTQLGLQSTISNLQAAVAMKDQQIVELNQSLATSRAPRKVRSPAALPSVSGAAATPAAASATSKPPAGNASQEFPVRVFDVLGRKVVTGQRQEKVERERHIYSDRGKYIFNGKNVVEDPYVMKTIKEYGYEITFSVRGLVREDSMVVASAGEGRQALTVPYDQLLKGKITLKTQPDQMLVSVGGRQEEFKIAW